MKKLEEKLQGRKLEKFKKFQFLFISIFLFSCGKFPEFQQHQQPAQTASGVRAAIHEGHDLGHCPDRCVSYDLLATVLPHSNPPLQYQP